MTLMRLGVLGYPLISIYLWPSRADAAMVNGTIDDGFGDSVTNQQANYYPNQSSWYNKLSNVDKSKAFDTTYTCVAYIGLEPIGISMNFMGRPCRICLFGYSDRHSTGTAIYVFFILANFNNSLTHNTANFTLDNHEPVLFSKYVGMTQYNVLVFSHTNLSNTLHTLNITTAAGPREAIYINFDYAIYT